MTSGTSRTTCAIAIIVAAIGLAGCGGGGGGNRAPVITSLVAASQAVWPGGTTAVTATAKDNDGDALTYTWTANGGTITGSGRQVNWNAPQIGGVFTITCMVSDGKGGQDTATEDITVGATVTGTVNDVSTDEPVAGVAVTIDGITDTTDAQGRFTIIGVSEGQHEITLGGNWVVAGAGVTVTTNTPGQTVQLPEPVPALNLGGGPPPPPFQP